MIIYIKMDLALNSLKRLICHKTQSTKSFSNFRMKIYSCIKPSNFFYLSFQTRSYSSNPSGSMGDLSRRDGSSMGYRSDRSHASTPDLVEKPAGKYIRGRRDPHFQPRAPPSDKTSDGKSDSIDGSRASEPRDGSREREARDGARPRGGPT